MRPGTGEPGVLPQRSADEWSANTPFMMERASTVLQQKAPRYRGARAPTTKIILSYIPTPTSPILRLPAACIFLPVDMSTDLLNGK